MRRPMLKWILYPLLSLIVLLGLAAGIITAEARSFRKSDLVARNVTIESLPVGDQPRSDALLKLEEQWVPTLPQELKLTHGQRSFTVSAEALGRQVQLEQAVDQAMRLGREDSIVAQVTTYLRLLKSPVDIPVTIEVQKAKTAAEIEKIAAEVDRAPVDARVTVTGSETVAVVAGKPGLKVDRVATAAAIEKALQSSQEKAALVVREKQPAITAKDLAHLEVVLGSYSTSYSAGKVDRSHNLQLAIEAINGAVVMPGETFSTDKAIGPRVTERGFRDAPIFADGEITPATGGGICQIASTIYNAALFAGLPIVERHHHSQPVTYTPPGRDATVYAGQLDLRFRNDTGSPIVLLGTMSGSRVTINIVGKAEANKKVRLERSGLTKVPYEKQEIPDPALPLGKKQVGKKGRDGIRVTILRIIRNADGTQKKETLHTDVYRPQKQVVRVGTKKPVGPDGKPLPLKLGPDGKPIIGADGRPVVLKPVLPKPAVKPVAGAAKKPETKKPAAHN
ncbi:MAG: VanW family protein [Armatimonadota bacterium]